jgi:hypothetical protein
VLVTTLWLYVSLAGSTLRRKILAIALVFGWIVYAGTTTLWLIFRGDAPLKDYTLGTNAAWVTIGVMLWVATEWFRSAGD